MKRVSAVLAAMATVLAAVPSAAADTSPPKPVRDAGRFTQLAIPDGALGVTGLRANADPDRVVAATVVLSTDSIVGARLTTSASAWLGSSAGMMPSTRVRSWNASSASVSMIGTYSTRPVSCSQECSGPMPG